MIEIAFDSSFKRAFRKKIAGNPGKEARFWKRVAIFKRDPFTPMLRTHKLSGELRDRWSFSLEYDLRVVFFFAGEKRAVFVDIGSHGEVY